MGCSKEPTAGKETAGGTQGLRVRKAQIHQKKGVIIGGGRTAEGCKESCSYINNPTRIARYNNTCLHINSTVENN